jgi:WD40 repeat protein
MSRIPERPWRAGADAESTSGRAMRAALEQQLEGTDVESAPPPIADHALIRRIGRGAYGDVWLARNALGSLRAVKIVYRARFKEDRPYEREFNGILRYEPVSRTHEGLVHVLHVGRNDEAGCFYYVMELADPALADDTAAGQSLATKPDALLANYAPRTLRSDLMDHGHLPPTGAARLAVQLAGALSHLHGSGLVHRDIKPPNVIFVDGRPKLADIGLVTDVGGAQSFVGTEGFIPPEGPGKPQADLYGLGKLLYESATGCDRMDFPILPPEATRLPEGEALLELNEVMTRACAPDPGQRYSTATELQADLNLFLAGRSLRRMRNIERYAARLKNLAAAACLFLVLVAGALWFTKNEERHAQERAEASSQRARLEAEGRAMEFALRQRAEAAERETQRQLYTALLEQARATVRSGEMGQRVRALDAIQRAAAISNSVELRPELLAALALPDLRFQQEMSFGPEYTVKQMDPKFERIAVCRGRGDVEIRSVPDARLLATLPASTNLMCFAADWSPDGRFMVVKRDYDTSGIGRDFEVWDLRSEPRRVMLIREGRFGAKAFHPHRPQLITGGGEGVIVAWDMEQGKELARGSFDATAERLAYSPDGNSVMASYQRTDGWGTSIHNAADGKMIVSNIFPNRIASFAWHPDGRSLALSDMAGGIHLLDAHTGKTQTLGRHKAEAVTTTFNSDGRFLITGAWGYELICWDVQRKQRAFSIDVESYIPQFSADGRACALITIAGVQLYTFETPEAHRELTEEMGPRLHHAGFSDDGRWLAVSTDKHLGVWDLQSGGPGAFAAEAIDARPFWTSDASELFASSTRTDNCYRWRVRPTTNAFTAPVLERLKIYRPGGFTSLCVKSNLVAWTGNQGSQVAGIEQAESGGNTWVQTRAGINGFSPDGRWLAVYAGFSPSLYIYRLPELEPVVKLTNQGRISGFSFSPSGEELAVVSRGHVELWSTTDWQRTRVATNFIGLSYLGTLFHPDGQSMWLAKNLRTAALYDAQTFEPLLPLPMGMFPLNLSPDGRQLVVSVDARRLQVWDLVQVRKRLRQFGLDWAETDKR